MKIFTARPERIIASVALASLAGGLPAGFVHGVLLGAKEVDHSVMQWANSIGQGLLFGPFLVFLAGLIVVAPVLSALRYFGYAGPGFVYLISGVLCLVALSNDAHSGFVTLLFSMTASYFFCRYAYPKRDD